MARKIFNIITTVLLILLILIVVIVFISRVNGKSPSIFGYHIFRVSSDSMVPTLEVGEIIVVKKCDVNEVKKGDIITYNATSGELRGMTITHRVVEAPQKSGDDYVLQTMGDKEGATMDPEISFSQVEGKYISSIKIAKHLYNFFLSPAGLIIFIGVIIALFAYEMISLIINYKKIDEHDDDYYEPKPKKESKKRKKPKKTHLN